MVQFLSIHFFPWISSIFVGFFKSSRFFVSSYITNIAKCATDDWFTSFSFLTTHASPNNHLSETFTVDLIIIFDFLNFIQPN